MFLADRLLNKVTMYFLVLNGLGILSIIAILLGFIGLLPYSGIQFSILLAVIYGSCLAFHYTLAKLFKATTNKESYRITALILFFLLSPIFNWTDLVVTIVACFIGMASRYAFAIEKKHIFNPAAIAIFLLGLFGYGNAIWWVGSTVLLPFVLTLGLAVVRKIRKFRLFLPFLGASLITISVYGVDPVQALTSWPLIFLGTIMLTEPLTTPPTKYKAMIYGALVGILTGAQFSVGPLHASPEFALVVGNIFSYIVSPKKKLFSELKERIQLAPTIFEFVFAKDKDFSFTPGQYLEWTIAHNHPDSRGNRRYFTIASSPTEKDLRLGVKIVEGSFSSAKKTLLGMELGTKIVASQLAGDFILPKDDKQKLAFIAGGIGVTPYRSIIKYLLDKKEKRDIIFFYTCGSESEFVYRDIFAQAVSELGIKVIYVITEEDKAPENWSGERGRISKEILEKHISDLKERKFYLSGPNAMVESYDQLIRSMGVGRGKIVKDYFPGF